MISFHFNQINNTFKSFSSSNRILNSYNLVSSKSFFDCVHRHFKISSHFIHFVYKCYSRNRIFISLFPNCFRLRLYSLWTIKNSNSTIKNSKRSFNLYSKVYVTWSVNDIYLMTFPESCSCSRSNSDTSFFFLFHPVHCSFTIVSFTYFMNFSSIEQNSFSSSCFTSIDMGNNTYISNFI